MATLYIVSDQGFAPTHEADFGAYTDCLYKTALMRAIATRGKTSLYAAFWSACPSLKPWYKAERPYR